MYHLGKRGLYTSSAGLRIAYLSGIFAESGDDDVCKFTTEDATALRDICLKGSSGFRGVDVLLTSQWPSDVFNLDGKMVELKENRTTHVNAWIASQLKPRYHVSGVEGVYYERSPYRNANANDLGSLEVTTRFIGLARVGNPKKERWLYALNLTPLDSMKIQDLMQRTTDETDCPYNLSDLDGRVLRAAKRKAEDSLQQQQQQQQQYFYDMSAPEEREKRKRRRGKVEFDQSKCWFCLASACLEKHLIVTVGDFAYLALAKGGLVEEHFIICPVEHYRCSVGQPEDVRVEVDKFKEALAKFYGRDEKAPVFFERNYKTSHMQIQSVPVPKAALRDLREIFEEEARGHGFTLSELDGNDRLDQVIPKNCPYFCVELPNSCVLYTKITPSMNFPLNFAREVLACGPVLDMESRSDWKDCKVEKEEEEKTARRIRTDFEPFDFTES